MKLVKTKKFKLFNEPWIIKYYEGIDIPDDPNGYRFGDCNSASRVIRINLIDDAKKPQPESILKLTELHELIHAILDSGQYNNSSQDEPMVEWLAKSIRNLMNQKIIN